MLTFMLLVFLTPAPPAPRVPNLAGTCQFGEVVQNGRKVFIVGEHWFATGEVKPSGLVFLRWSCKGSATEYLGLYEVQENGHWKGHYGIAEKVEVTDKHICGEITGETLYWKKAE